MKLYLVGDKRSAKSKQWLAVTPYQEEAQSLVESMKGATCVREITINQRRKR